MVTRARWILGCCLGGATLLHCNLDQRELSEHPGSAGSGGTQVGTGGSVTGTGSGGTDSSGTGGGGTSTGGGSGGSTGGATSGSGGSGGTDTNGDAGAGGGDTIEDTACPSGQPGLLNTFENNSFQVCPPREGHWGYMQGEALTPCPVLNVCSIGSGLVAAHPHVLVFEPSATGLADGLILDLRTAEGPPSPSAGTYTGISFDVLGPSGGQFELRIEGYTTDNVYLDGLPGGAPGGDCIEPGGDCWIPYEVTVPISGVAWERVTVDFSSMVRDPQPENAAVLDPSKLLYLQFVVTLDYGFSLDNVELETD